MYKENTNSHKKAGVKNENEKVKSRDCSHKKGVKAMPKKAKNSEETAEVKNTAKSSGKATAPVKEKKERVNKDVVIRARVTAEERERFEKKAAEMGFSTVSELIRSLVAEDEEEDTDSEKE